MASDKNKDMVRCIDCKHGTYLQWFQNPVICVCHMRDEERFVAAARRLCFQFEKGTGNTEVKHLDHY